MSSAELKLIGERLRLITLFSMIAIQTAFIFAGFYLEVVAHSPLYVFAEAAALSFLTPIFSLYLQDPKRGLAASTLTLATCIAAFAINGIINQIDITRYIDLIIYIFFWLIGTAIYLDRIYQKA